MQQKDLSVSILIPCLNEAETIAVCITKAKKFLAAHNIKGEVLVADNGSTDGSQKLASAAGAKVIHITQKGYGSALLGGIKAASGKYIIMGDADDSYNFLELEPFINALHAGFDLVMGNRFMGGIKPNAMPFLHRYLGNPVLSWLGRLFFKVDIGDFHCGLRGFRREAILALDLQTTGMEFASEMTVKASLKKLKITEVPTILYPDGRSRPPHLRTWSDGWRHLRFLLLYSPRWLFYYPGIALMISGLALSVWLLPEPRKVGALTLDINTLMYAAFLSILGLQAVLFSLLTKVFAISAGLLPQDADIQKLIKWGSLEKGIVVAVLMIGLGLTSSIGALVYWSANSFGPIDPTHSMRLVIPGTMLFAMGFQILLSSFFLSILQTNRK
ncbi:MAG: glycosyltransferase family 2 protein [Anaerolineales bacterium]|nr:glycosyltransferase family 2 protein [Anaerolineales bacterium]